MVQIIISMAGLAAFPHFKLSRQAAGVSTVTTVNAGVLFFLLAAVIPLCTAVSLDFPSFDRDTKLTCSPGGKGICLQGDAFVNRGLQLTKNQIDGPITSSAGRAVYSESVHIWDAATHRAADFTTRFSFLIHDVDAGDHSGDGLAFFLSAYPSLIPDHSSGGFLGLFPNYSLAARANHRKVVAVEFDTYRNTEWDLSPGDHIGIDVDSLQSAAELTLEGGIKKKARVNVWVNYIASSQTLSVSLYYGEDRDSDQGNINLSHFVDLREVLPEYVAIGFSAATGSWVETHSILSWSFHSVLETKNTGYSWVLEIVLLMAAVMMGGMNLSRLFMWIRRRTAGEREWRNSQEKEDRDLYSPLCMEETGGTEEGRFTVDAEPMEMKAGRREGKLDTDIDAIEINRERRLEGFSLNIAETAEGVAGKEEELRMESVLEEEEEDEGKDTSSDTGLAADVRDEGEEALNGSADVEPAVSDREAVNDETSSIDDAEHMLENICGVAESAGSSKNICSNEMIDENIIEDVDILLDGENLGDVVSESVRPSDQSEVRDDTGDQDTSSDTGHLEEALKGSVNTSEGADAIMVASQAHEEVRGISSGGVHLERGGAGIDRKAEDITHAYAKLVMGRGTDEDGKTCSCSRSVDQGVVGDGIRVAESTGNAEAIQAEVSSLGVELTEGEEAASDVLTAMVFMERSPEEIPYQALVIATENFSEERMLGRGGFGAVYKGFLTDWGIDVAIKKLSHESLQGIKEYVSEVKIISQLRHRNLVKLIGWCHEQGQLLLVYEFMSKGSLDHHLFDEKAQLAWPARYNIVLGLANALLYLHEDCEQYVVHRDVKTSNVLLDERFDAKLADFGLARLFNNDISSFEVSQLAGTRGYMAPEYALLGKASKGSDVYSFGVVVLEIACGMRSVQVTKTSAEVGGSSAMLLVEGVWELYGKEAILEAADWRLGGSFDRQRMERLLVVGLWCAHPDVNQRPSISLARLALLNPETVPLPELPAQMPPWASPLAAGPAEVQPQVDQPSPILPKKPSRSVFTRLTWWWKRRKPRNPRKITDDEIRMETDEIRMGSGAREFPYDELHRATRGFAVANKLGTSDYWEMYKAALTPGKDVAVKRFLQTDGQGKPWYLGEMLTLSHLAHKNLVKLVGWCHEGDEFLLVVEYLPNGSLDRHLFGGRGSMALPWDVRYKVAVGVAAGLCYLHDWGLCVLHRDIKSENVMLDGEFNAKLGGFELSRVVDHDLSSFATTQIAGTVGYMAPEYAIAGTYTKESDVYSFGVVALELACGRKTVDRCLPRPEQHLLQWMEECHRQRRLLSAVDPKLGGAFNKQEIERLMTIGLWCTNYKPVYRPQMAKVLRALQFKEAPPNPPRK